MATVAGTPEDFSLSCSAVASSKTLLPASSAPDLSLAYSTGSDLEARRSRSSELKNTTRDSRNLQA